MECCLWKWLSLAFTIALNISAVPTVWKALSNWYTYFFDKHSLHTDATYRITFPRPFLKFETTVCIHYCILTLTASLLYTLFPQRL